MDGAGRIDGERAAPLGIQQIHDGEFAAALDRLLGDWSREAAPRLACGMIGSRQGWVEAPYMDCPAAFDALATRLARTPDGTLEIVPGLVCRDAQGVPDVMRGEETQIVGTLADDSPPTLVILPGTHSKWAIVRAGRIDAFWTCMTGEVYAVLKSHSILGRMIAPGEPPPVAGAFARGVRCTLAQAHGRGALLHHLFGARTLALFDEVAPADVADYLSGLLIGSEIAAGRDWAIDRGIAAVRATLIGAPALCDRYSAALAEAGIAAVAGPRDAAAHGLWKIARRAGRIQ
jgi:2-dehydro-3-deoxygalactonokinase